MEFMKEKPIEAAAPPAETTTPEQLLKRLMEEQGAVNRELVELGARTVRLKERDQFLSGSLWVLRGLGLKPG